MQIKKIKLEDSVSIALLHVEGISNGFLSSLGERFVSALYEAVAESDDAFGYVAQLDGRVVGFVTFTTDINALYKSVLKKNFLRFSFLLAGKMLSWQKVKRIFQTLMYPKKVSETDLPKAELLSIAVDSQARGHGVAKKLVEQGLEECKRRGIDKVKVMVAAENDAANKLYQKCGFEFNSQIESHSVLSNIYVAKL